MFKNRSAIMNHARGAKPTHNDRRHELRKDEEVRVMKNLFVNRKNGTIEMSKKFAAAASNPFSDEYAQLNSVRRDYPKFKIVTVSQKAAKPDFKGLTYDYMRKYIVKHDDADKSIMAEFEMLTATSEEATELLMEAASYHEVKTWFLDQFPEIKAFQEKREKLLEKIAAKAEAEAKAKAEALASA